MNFFFDEEQNSNFRSVIVLPRKNEFQSVVTKNAPENHIISRTL